MSEHDTTASDDRDGSIEGPEDRGAPVEESHILVTDHHGRTRIDIAGDAAMRPGPGQGVEGAIED